MTQAERDKEAERLASAAQRLATVLPRVAFLLAREADRLRSVRAVARTEDEP